MIVSKDKTAFARRAGSGRGLDASQAIAAASVRIDGMNQEMNGHIGKTVRAMQELTFADQAEANGSYERCRAYADELVGLCGLFDLPDVGAAASSLCKLFDGCLPAHPDVSSVIVHVHALLGLLSLAPTDRAAAALSILTGLHKVVDARKLNGKV